MTSGNIMHSLNRRVKMSFTEVNPELPLQYGSSLMKHGYFTCILSGFVILDFRDAIPRWSSIISGAHVSHSQDSDLRSTERIGLNTVQRRRNVWAARFPPTSTNRIRTRNSRFVRRVRTQRRESYIKPSRWVIMAGCQGEVALGRKVRTEVSDSVIE